MSDKVVYMINITHDERSRSQKYEWSIKSWAKWCNKNNVELFVHEEPMTDLNIMQPQWYKIFIFELLKNSGLEPTQILYVDSDTIVHPDAPNFFDMRETKKFCAVPCYGSMDWVMRSIEVYSKVVFDGFDFGDYWTYFNTGFMMFQQGHKDLFDSMIEWYDHSQQSLNMIQQNYSVGKDQPAFNFFIKDLEVPINLLPYEYNMQDMSRFEVIGDDFLFTRYGWVYHFNCGVKPSPGYWLEKTYKHFYE